MCIDLVKARTWLRSLNTTAKCGTILLCRISPFRIRTCQPPPPGTVASRCSVQQMQVVILSCFPKQSNHLSERYLLRAFELQNQLECLKEYPARRDALSGLPTDAKCGLLIQCPQQTDGRQLQQSLPIAVRE